jgi:prepilin-type processing-associated H-X9-DG protein
MSFAILGLGTAVPETLLTQTEAMQIARSLCCRTSEQTTWLPAMYDHTGIQRRNLVLGRDVVEDVIHGTRASGSVFLPTGAPDDAGPTTGQRMEHYAAGALPLALAASRQALEASGRGPHDVTHLVTVSCTGFRAPGVDVGLIGRLGLAPTVGRANVGFMGCHGTINGLRVARAFTGADPRACVLLCATELCSLHYHYGWDPQKIIANALFADGSAAAVGVAEQAAPLGGWRVADTSSCLLPDSEDAMTWTVSDHGFEMTLSKRVPDLIARHLRPWLTAWLDRNGLRPEEVGSWAVHPGGPRILSAVEETLGLRREQTAAARAVFAEHGNMSSPTVLFIVERLRRERAPRPCVALAFGPGLVAEAALFV